MTTYNKAKSNQTKNMKEGTSCLKVNKKYANDKDITIKKESQQKSTNTLNLFHLINQPAQASEQEINYFKMFIVQYSYIEQNDTKVFLPNTTIDIEEDMSSLCTAHTPITFTYGNDPVKITLKPLDSYLDKDEVVSMTIEVNKTELIYTISHNDSKFEVTHEFTTDKQFESYSSKNDIIQEIKMRYRKLGVEHGILLGENKILPSKTYPIKNTHGNISYKTFFGKDFTLTKNGKGLFILYKKTAVKVSETLPHFYININYFLNPYFLLAQKYTTKTKKTIDEMRSSQEEVNIHSASSNCEDTTQQSPTLTKLNP